ncbi:tetratricopeptide repeat protein [bacterium AH-315-C20]|nr:tetratricopeptide repeat protein [bacterium AH-315-C20]
MQLNDSFLICSKSDGLFVNLTGVPLISRFTGFLSIIILLFLCPLQAWTQEGELSPVDINSFDNLPNDEEKTRAAYSFINTATDLYNNHQYDSAFYFLGIARRLADQLNSDRLYADVFYAEGRANYFKGQHKKAGESYLLSIQYLNGLKDTADLAKTYNSLGVVKKHQGKYYEAVRALNTSLKYYHTASDKKGMALVDLNMGNVLKNLGKSDQAKKKYMNACAVFTKYEMKSNQASCLNNLGNLYKSEEKYDSAYFYLSKTLRLRLELDDDILLSYAYHNMANLYSDMGKFDSAIYYINASLAIKSQYNNRFDVSTDYESYGAIYAKQKKWKRAIFYYKQAFEIYDSVGFAEDRMKLAKELAMAYHQNGDNTKSASMFKLHFEILDSINAANSSNLLQNELSQYEYFTDSIQSEQLRLQKQLLLAQDEKKRLATESSQKRLFYPVIIFGLLVLMIARFLVSTRKRLAQTREYQAVLQSQNEELRKTLISKEEKEILLKEIHHRVKNNLQIINSLIRLQSNFMDKGNFREKLMETENRIRSMGLIHEKLYKSDDLASLSIRNYIEELSIHILESYENNLRVKFKFEIQEQNLGIDSLIPLGLIINEILSNSLKYAFFEREQGKVFLQFYIEDKKTYINIWDDGIGAVMTVDELKEDSLGMDLIWSLTDQLDGIVKLDTGNGFRYEFEFPVLK